MRTLQMLRNGRGRLANPEDWTKGYGDPRDGTCMIGSLYLEVCDNTYGTGLSGDFPGRAAFEGACHAIHRAIFGVEAPQSEFTVGDCYFAPGEKTTSAWNDARDRTHAEVMAAWDHAIAAEEAREQQAEAVTPEAVAA